MQKSTLTLLIAAIVGVGLVPETAVAKGGYIPPSEVDSNSVQAAQVRSMSKRAHTRTARASGRDCGQAAQEEATNARYAGVAGSFVPVAGPFISGLAGFFSIGASAESMTKWKSCMRFDVKNGIAKIDKDMHVAVANSESRLSAQIVTIAQDIHAEQQRYEERLVSLELTMASVPRILTTAPENMPLCPGCDKQIGDDLPAEAASEQVPEAQTSEVPKPVPVSPSSAQEPPKDVAPPVPVRKKLPELLPGEQYAKSSAYTCLNGTC